jgi:NADP-dependent 3-hydroxy acid dehydrogenase YdfG
MDFQLNGRRALVTGSSIGIGEAIAKALADEGAFVAVHGRDHDCAERVSREIAEAGYITGANLRVDGRRRLRRRGNGGGVK